jgi:hypothetical protein
MSSGPREHRHGGDGITIAAFLHSLAGILSITACPSVERLLYQAARGEPGPEPEGFGRARRSPLTKDPEGRIAGPAVVGCHGQSRARGLSVNKGGAPETANTKASAVSPSCHLFASFHLEVESFHFGKHVASPPVLDRVSYCCQSPYQPNAPSGCPA